MAVGGGGGSGGMGSAIQAGRAYVATGVDLSGLESGLQKAKKVVLNFSKDMAAAGAGVLALGASITAPILLGFHSAVDEITGVRKAAEQLGAGTEEVSALGYAAKKAGVDLDGLVTSGRHMQKVLSDAAAGDAGASGALAKLGVDAKALINLPLEDQFAAIADGIQALPTAADQAAAAMEIFGKAGADLVPVLRKGSAGLRDIRQDAENMGAIVSADDAAKAKDYTKAMGQAREAVEYFWKSVGASVLDAIGPIKDVSKTFVAVVQSSRRWVEENRGIVLSVLSVGTAITAIGTGLIGLGGVLAAAAVASTGFSFAWGVITAGLSTAVSIVPALLTVAVPFIAMAGIVVGVAYAFGQLDNLWELVVDTGKEVVDTGKEVAGAFSFVRTEAEAAAAVVSTAWQGIRDAMAVGDTQGGLAVVGGVFDVLGAKADLLWSQVKLGAQKGWNAVKEFALDAWDDAVAGAAKMIVKVQFKLQDFGTDIKGKLFAVWKDINDGFLRVFTITGKGIVSIIAAAFDALMSAATATGKFIIDQLFNPSARTKALKDAGVIAAPGIAAVGVAGTAAGNEVNKGKELADAQGVEVARKLVQTKRDQLLQAIDDLNEQQKQARRDRDAGKVREAQAEVEKKRLALNQAVAALDAKSAELAKNRLQKAIDAEVASWWEPKAGEAMAAINAGSSRGAFGVGANASQMFGANTGSIQEKQLKAQEKIAEDVGDIKNNGGGLKAW